MHSRIFLQLTRGYVCRLILVRALSLMCTTANICTWQACECDPVTLRRLNSSSCVGTSQVSQVIFCHGVLKSTDPLSYLKTSAVIWPGREALTLQRASHTLVISNTCYQAQDIKAMCRQTERMAGWLPDWYVIGSLAGRVAEQTGGCRLFTAESRCPLHLVLPKTLIQGSASPWRAFPRQVVRREKNLGLFSSSNRN